jgi:hypothetical protein
MSAASCSIPTLHESSDLSDTPTMVVLQGTGLSYPSVDCRKRFDHISDYQIARAEKWSSTREKSFQLYLPQRMPDESPATMDQLMAIKSLVRSITGSALENLGSEQAEYLIHEIKSLQDLFSEIKIHEYLDRQRSMSRLSVIFFMAVIGYALIMISH